MPSFLLSSFLIVAALTAAQVALVTLSLWEIRRFAASRLGRRRQLPRAPRVALFAPCKGLDVGLKDNLRPLFEQDYCNYQITFIVESAEDPACRTIRELIAENRSVPAQLLVAGIADDTGQKVYNLRVATADLPDNVEVLAFVDSDARPRANWLARLVERLARAEVGAVTGYRWFVPERSTLSNLLSYSINSALAAGLGPGGHHLIWGGSWAVRRDVFDSLRLHKAWNGTLSDDLVATRVLQQAGMRIDFEPCCMLASPVDNDWRQTLSFIRRQYVIARSYLPRWWLLAFIASTLSALTFWGGLALTIAGGFSEAPTSAWPEAICLALYATMVVRGGLRCWIASLYLPEHRRRLRTAYWFDIWAGPLTALVNWLLLTSSLVGRELHWRGTRYRLQANGRVQVLRPTEVISGRDKNLPHLAGPHCLAHSRRTGSRPVAAPTSSTAS
jgi:ceramide glucosyltransferase